MSRGRVLLSLAFLAASLPLLIAGLSAIRPRTVPAFGPSSRLAPAPGPSRYDPPDPPAAPRLPPMPEPLRLARRGVLSVEVTSRPEPGIFHTGPLLLDPRRPALLFTQTVTGLSAQELVDLWDAQRIDCSASPEQTLTPTYALRFFDAAGPVLSVSLCWICGEAEVVLERNRSRCTFERGTRQADQLKQKLLSLLAPPLLDGEWPFPEPEPPSVISFGPVITRSPDAAALMQSGIQSYQDQLASCDEQHRAHPQIAGQLVIEYDLGPYTPKDHKALLARNPMTALLRRERPKPGSVLAAFKAKHLTTGQLPVHHVTLVRSTLSEPALTECVLNSMRHWQLRRRPSLERTPLHASVQIEFRASSQSRAKRPVHCWSARAESP